MFLYVYKDDIVYYMAMQDKFVSQQVLVSHDNQTYDNYKLFMEGLQWNILSQLIPKLASRQKIIQK